MRETTRQNEGYDTDAREQRHSKPCNFDATPLRSIQNNQAQNCADRVHEHDCRGCHWRSAESFLGQITDISNKCHVCCNKTALSQQQADRVRFQASQNVTASVHWLQAIWTTFFHGLPGIQPQNEPNHLVVEQSPKYVSNCHPRHVWIIHTGKYQEMIPKTIPEMCFKKSLMNVHQKNIH